MTLTAGIDLGGTKIQAVIVDARRHVLGAARRPTPVTGGPPDVAAALVDAVGQATADAGIDIRSLHGVGVGSPGDIDATAGTVTEARNLPGWSGSYELADVLSDRLGVPVHLGNDVQVGTQAEFDLGAGRPFRSLLGVFWGTGVGGGLVLDGKPWLGREEAGEIGHMVIKLGGARCPCGRLGCVEAYAGRAAMETRARKLVSKGARTELFKLMEKRGRTRLTSGIWARALEAGDPLARELIDRAVAALAAGIASVVNVLDIEAIVIGGGLGDRLGQPYVDRITAAMQPHLFADDRPPAVMPSGLGDLGGAIGAARLVATSRRSVPQTEAGATRHSAQGT